ncbi:M16 family metallopeptidase [Streptomyces huiliensis]|uniref:M16 family metallopeptidase n=1 Tax=Streptomyces huiliensis TaxID=2876027 RepID=UPI001CBE4CBD|nr:M16 family metallopeptidase [Streptomyces huiliensis]MBZ4320396.1 insulinase family protein [Streptomyces huiliensis]
MADETREAPRMRKATLRNGLRVVVERHPGSPRTAVCVHYGVGYRSERPEREGFAHLFEHLMFRGSANLPTDGFFAHVHPVGGLANGTTHQDYTDYHQLVPGAALERALFAEADRMRAPVFTEQTLAEQLDGIATEIHQAVTARPYGGLPWPLLPGVVFDRFANAHDGYGTVDRLRTATVAECEEFFREHYAPGNAVLTVVGDHDPDDVLALAERHFGDIPARPFAPAPDLREPVPARDRWVTCTEPEVTAAAFAVGHRLPDPRTATADYLAYVVLAEMINHHGLEGLQAASAACGVFGPLDARDPDLLVVTALVPPMVPPRRAVEALTDGWASYADDPDFAARQEQAVRRLVTRHHREHADAYTRGRALGRLELLFGRAELLDAHPGLLAGTGPDRVADAARRLGTAAKGVLVMVPGETRSRPAPIQAPATAATAPAVPPTATGSSRPVLVPVPVPGEQPAPRHGPRCETTLPGGIRLVAVRDGRSPLVELRLRLPLGEAGWRHPQEAAALVRLLAGRHGSAARAEAEGGSFQATTDGEWLDVTGYTLPEKASGWLESLAALAEPLDAVPVPAGRPGRHHDPGRVLDAALRRHWSAGREPLARPLDLGAVHRSLVTGGGALVAVGDLDPERFAADARRALSAWPAPRPAPDSVPATPGGVLELHHPASDAVHLTLSAPEPAGDPAAADRYLATAMVGAHYLSRLSAHASGTDLDHTLVAGRDVCLGTHRVFIRLTLPRRDAARGVRSVREGLRTLLAVPVTEAELEPVRTFCAGQLLGAFDSPAAKADLLRDGVSAGRPANWAERLPALLRQVTAAEVGTACATLFAADAMTLVALGAPGPVAEAVSAW